MMNANLKIRPAQLEDVPQLCAVHAGSDGPWVNPVEGAIWVNHRLGRPLFAIDVAEWESDERGAIVVGHAEWILGDEAGFLGRQLYLGMLQVHPAYRGRGVGRAMVRYGCERARRLSCRWVRVFAEEGAEGFYRKCGFQAGARVVSYAVPVQRTAWPAGWQRSRSVPNRVVRTLPMRLGWAQACSTFMWELCNRPTRVAGEEVHHPCARRTGGGAPAHVQLRHLGAANEALVLAWGSASEAVPVYLAAAMALARSYTVDTLNVVLPEAEVQEMAEYGQLVDSEVIWELAMTS